MNEETKIYQRKISDEEAQNNYILIVKSAIDLFPKAGKTFKLKVKGKNQDEEKEYEVSLSLIQRWSVGPTKKNKNYKINTRDFRDIFPIHFGKKITIAKISKDEFKLS